MAMKFTRFHKIWEGVKALWDDSALASHTELSKLEKCAHFLLLIWRSFTRNRCPARASALAYATLLALIPMLAVVVSITSSILKKRGEDSIDQFIARLVTSVTSSAMLSATNMPAGPALAEGSTNQINRATNGSTNQISGTTTNTEAAGATPQERGRSVSVSISTTNGAGAPSFDQEEKAVQARKAIAWHIHEFIQNTRSGTLGVTGSVVLIFVAISMLGRIEDTFNDIWGVTRGRNWFTRIVLYWGVVSLAPILVVVALGLASGPHLDWTKKLLTTMPFLSKVIFDFLPIVLLCLTFALFYMLMPNTKVRWRAALVGGLVGGILWHLNNLVSVLYVSRVVSNSKIYGSLGLVAVFMIGLYCSWLILLFGAQVAYAFQNRRAYLEEKQVENVNQRGREFVALRLMTCVGQRFLLGEPAPGITEIGAELSVPTRLIHELMNTLTSARLVIETAGDEPAFAPARPLETITCHDILLAMRAGQGQELATREGPGRIEVYGEFNRIEEAERLAASSVTLLALANRAMTKQIAGGSEGAGSGLTE